MSEPQSNKSLFPKISRFITERWKLLLVGFTSLLLLLGIFFQGTAFSQNLKAYEKAQNERSKLSGELSYWQQIVKEYGGYRDAYFRIASLEYQLGNVANAKESLKKVLGLDPNFENARVLGDKIKAHK